SAASRRRPQPTSVPSASPPMRSSAASCAAGSARSGLTSPTHHDEAAGGRPALPRPEGPGCRAPGAKRWRAGPTPAIISKKQQSSGAGRLGGRMDLGKLSRGERIIVVAGVLLVIDLLFLPWHSVTVPYIGSVDSNGISPPNA